jgi:hypothetical protein
VEYYWVSIYVGGSIITFDLLILFLGQSCHPLAMMAISNLIPTVESDVWKCVVACWKHKCNKQKKPSNTTVKTLMWMPSSEFSIY